MVHKLYEKGRAGKEGNGKSDYGYVKILSAGYTTLHWFMNRMNTLRLVTKIIFMIYFTNKKYILIYYCIFSKS